MKVFLDDIRKPPEGYVLCNWPDQVIELLQTGKVEVLSLDHDLGDDSRGTGWTVVLWLLEQVHRDPRYPIPEQIFVHSQNPVGAERMRGTIRRIREIQQEVL